MASTTVNIEAHPIEVTTGHWCASCSSPSAVCVTVAFAASDSLRVLGRATGEHCLSCDRTDVHR